MSEERQERVSSTGWSARGRAVFVLAFVLGGALLLVACGGSSSSNDSSSSDEVSGIIQSDDLDSPAAESPSPAAADGVQAAPDSGDDSTSAETPEEIAPEDVFLAFAQCLRDEGLDVSDPDASAGRGPGGFLRGVDRDDPEVRAALETCRPLIESARPELTDEQRAERQDAQIAFAACLREQGLDVSDPDPNGGGPGGGGLFRSGNIDPQNPEVRAAIETCRAENPDFGGRLGGGRRG